MDSDSNSGRAQNLTLAEKEARSIGILEEALSRFQGKIATTFTGGKDSLTVLHLLRSSAAAG